MTLDSLVGSYCIVNGLQSAAAKHNNGAKCFVLRPDTENEGRLHVAFERDVHVGAEDTHKAKLVSIKASNLTPAHGVAVRPSTVAGGGMGLFATRDFKRGETVIEERPLFTESAGNNFMRLMGGGAAAYPAAGTVVSDILSGLVSSSPASPTASSWAARMHLNRLSNADGTSSIYPIICRINHGCMAPPRLAAGANSPAKNASSSPSSLVPTPKSNVWWYAKCGESPRCVTASRPIKAGDEIFADYCETSFDAASRLVSLRKYGLNECDSGCGLCDPSPLTKRAIAAYDKAIAAVEMFEYDDFKSGAMAARIQRGQMPPLSLANVEEAYAEARAAVVAVLRSVYDPQANLGNDDNPSALHLPPPEESDLGFNFLNPALNAYCVGIATVFHSMLAEEEGQPKLQICLQKLELALSTRNKAILSYCGGNTTQPFFKQDVDVFSTELGNSKRAAVITGSMRRR